MKIIARKIGKDGHLGPESDIDLTGAFDIRIGEYPDFVIVSVSDGWVQVRASNGALEIRPTACNTALVRQAPDA